MHFKLFSDCVLVEGHNRSLVYDLARNVFYPLSNQYAQVLNDCVGKTTTELVDKYSSSIENFLQEFVAMDVGFFTDVPELFPEMNLEFKHPSQIITASIEIDKTQAYDSYKNLDKVIRLGCKYLQLSIVSGSDIKKSEIESLLDLVNDSFIVRFDLIVGANAKMDLDGISEYCARLNTIVVLDSDKNRKYENKNDVTVIELDTSNLDYADVIKEKNFNINIIKFAEAQLHNLGLNRNVCIDKHGDIKNHLNHKLSFGNTNDSSLDTIVSSKDFQRLWNIPNSKIEICKDCEYRFACVSNSNIIEKDGKLYKENYCTLKKEHSTLSSN